MGHIELAVPVSHIWFFKCSPSRIGLVLDKTASDLERVLYYEDYMVIEPGDTPLKYMQLLSEPEYHEALEKYGENFEAMMGAEAVRRTLNKVDLVQLMQDLEEQIENTRSKQTRKKITKRMKIADGFRVSGAHPEWMVLDCLPVIPPELRPLVPLDGGRFTESDGNRRRLMVVRSALEAREDCLVDLFGQIRILFQPFARDHDHSSARTAQSFVGCRRNNMRELRRAFVRAGND